MSYEQYCSMTWAEFQIRLFSLNRVNLQLDLRAREVAYNARIAPHYNIDKNVTKNKFWPLTPDKGLEREKVLDMKEKLLQARRNEKKRNNGG